jgi:predicted ATPase/DNA-binding CsgD family transcriptional regulator
MNAASDLEQPAWAGAGHGNLPAQLTSFIGRAAELAQVRALAGGARLVTLTGSAGCGKTRLGLQALAGLAGDHADGAWLVELAALSDPAQVAASIAAALPVARQGSFAAPAELAAAVRAKDLIILLDNCEHLIRGCAEVAECLLRGCPQVVILATSREPLGVPGEVTWRVPSLSFPAAGAAGVAELAGFEAVQLFVDRAGHARPGFELTGENAAAVAEICARLDGIPLAIELAAAQVRVLPAGQIAGALQDRLGLLAGGARTALPRQQTLEASIRWSYALLAEPERRLLQRLSVCAGGFTLEAAETIGADGPADAGQVLGLVSQLADKSLILPGGEGSDGRFGMLESIRDYAARRLAESGTTGRARQRHLDFFFGYARRRPGERDGPYRERLRSDYANLRQALEWAAGRDDPRLLELATALVAYWSASTRLAEARQWLQTAIATVTTGDAALRARALGGLAQVAGLAFDFPTAAAAGAESLAMLRELDDKPGMVVALTSLGFIAAPLAQPDSGLAYLTEAAALAGELGDDAAQAYALALIGRSAINHPGDRPAARAALRRALELARTCGDVRTEGIAVCELGVLAALDGNPVQAMPYLAEALRLLSAGGDVFFRSLCLVCMVHFHGLSGDTSRADAACSELDAITSEMGAAALYYVHWARGWAAFCRGDWAEAIRAYTAELSYPGPVGLAGFPTAVLAWSQLRAGQADQARQRTDEFLSTHDPARSCPALPLAVRALTARADGDGELADDLAHRALLASTDDPFGQVASWICLVIAAPIIGDRGRHTLAAQLAAAAAGFARRIGMVPLPAAEDLLTSVRARCREALGDEPFSRAETEGAGMSLADAAAYASRGRGARGRPATGWASLTPTELRVAAAVTDGLSNPKIAERLLITRRTVTTHLTSIYRKLGVSTRAELAATATRHQHETQDTSTHGTDRPDPATSSKGRPA